MSVLVGTREKDDFYRTPAACTRALLAVENFPRVIWEPACGDGAISRVLDSAGHDVVSTDLIDRGYGAHGHDFLQETRAPEGCAIVTNPPFKLADQFILHARALGVQQIAVFLRLSFLEGQARHSRLWSISPPARVWVCSKRQTLWRGDDPEPRTTGGTLAFAWFVWRANEDGAKIGWLT